MDQANHVLVTSTAFGVPRDVYAGELGPALRLSFLEDVAPEDRQRLLSEVDAAIVLDPAAELSAADISAMRALRFVQTLTSGIDHIPAALFPAQVKIGNTAGSTALPIAEHGVAMILAAYKRLIFEHNQLAKGDWGFFRPNRSLHGATVGILGYGGIGRKIAELLRPFGVTIEAINRSGRTHDPIDYCGSLADLGEAIRRWDVIVVSASLNSATRALLDRALFERMKPGAVLVVLSRAEIVDEQDLYSHLVAVPAFTACLDAWWEEPLKTGRPFSTRFPFLELPNFIGSPHNSSMVPSMPRNMVVSAARNVARFFHDGTGAHFAAPGDLAR